MEEKEELTKEPESNITGTKLLIAGTTNSGKTTLIKDLQDAVIFSCDGKPFPFNMFHANFKEITSAEDFKNKVNALFKAYFKIKGNKPKIIVFDSISTIIGTMYLYLQQTANTKNGYDIWNKYLAEVTNINNFIDDVINTEYGIDAILITHAQYNIDIEKWEDTTKGSFAKKDGGFISTVDYSIFIDVIKGNKRYIYLDDAFRLSRTKLDLTDDEKKVDSNEFNLQNYLDRIASHKKNVGTFSLL